MAKETRLTSMKRQAKDFIAHLTERKEDLQKQIDLVDSEIAVKMTAKRELNKELKALELNIKEEQQVLDKLEA